MKVTVPNTGAGKGEGKGGLEGLPDVWEESPVRCASVVAPQTLLRSQVSSAEL